MCLLSQLLSKVTHMLQFLHQMFNLFALLRDDPLKPVTPLTNGAISIKRSNSLPHSVTIACFSWLILSWIVDIDRPSVEGHPKQRKRLDSSPDCLRATCKARWTWLSHAAGTSVCSWQCMTARRPTADIRARCQCYSCRIWQLLWTITETINILFLVVNLLTCVMCCYRSRLVFSCCLLTFHKVV